eukprot:scaffold21813_cov149-Isochrysis_galbana.AAC.2
MPSTTIAKYRNAQARASAKGANEPTTKYNSEMRDATISTYQKRRWDTPIFSRLHQETQRGQRTIIHSTDLRHNK